VRSLAWVVALVGAGMVQSADAQRPTASVNGYVTLASGYWEHGLSQNDGASLQLGVDYQHPSGFFVGARAASVDFALEYSYAQRRDVEANVYGGFHRRREDWTWTVGLGRYAYPGTAIDYDYTTLDASVGYRDRVFYTVSASDEYYGVFRSSLSQAVDATFPLRGNLELAVGVGRFGVSGETWRISHWNLGVSKLVGPVALDLRYYDSNYDELHYLGDPAADHWVLSASYELRRRPR